MKRRREVAWTELCLELELLIPPDDNHHDSAVRHLPECLDSLGPTAREALDLHYRSCLRLAVIGDKLHRTEGAVKLLMFRAGRLCGTAWMDECETAHESTKYEVRSTKA